MIYKMANSVLHKFFCVTLVFFSLPLAFRTTIQPCSVTSQHKESNIHETILDGNKKGILIMIV